MKKSIFLFFAAILCAMTANAQLYLRGGFNGWGSSDEFKFVDNVCEIELAGVTTFEFKIADSGWGTNYGGDHTFTATATKTLTSGAGNMKITTTIPGTYKFEFVENTKTLTVTYPEVPAPHDITVRAKLPATWTSSTITAWAWTSEDATATSVIAEKDGDYYKITKNAGALYVIFRNGDGWNGDKNQTVDLVYTEDVCLQLNQSGDAKATATVIDCGAVSKDITVKAVVPGAWEDEITAWVWPTGGEGEEVIPTKEGNWYVITKNCIELNIIFKNGKGWNGNENQTVNVEGVTENICYQISALTKVDGKCSVTEVDCDATIEPEAKPEPTPTYDYYVVGTINDWALKDANYGMTDENADGVYEKEVTLTANNKHELKINNGSWDDNTQIFGFDQLSVKYEGVSRGSGDGDNNVVIELTEDKTITVKFDKNAKKITLDGLTESTAPTKYYVVGTFTDNWTNAHADYELTLEGEVYKKSLTLDAGEHMFKITDGTWNNDATWGYGNITGSYVEIDEGTNDEGEKNGNIKVTLAAQKTFTVIFDATADKITFEGLTEVETETLVYTVEVPEGTEECYIAGQMNNWEFDRMTQVNATQWTITYDNVLKTTEYKYACKKDWAYAEVIEGGGNRTVWQELDQVEEWGKPADPAEVKCYLMGNGDWDNGVEMTLNPDNDNEYMLLDHYISAPFKFKLGDEWSDQVENYDFPGIDWVDGNITLPEGYYDFYFKKDIKKAYIAAVYLRDVTNKWGTICLPHASTSFSGAKFYEVSSLDPTKGLWLDEIEAGAQLVAGKPYVFEATASTIKVTYTDAAVDAPEEGANGLTGTFTDIAAAEDGVLVGNYIIGGNKVHVATAQNDLPANRAYINAALVPNKVQAEIPGRRRVCMGENATTGLDQIVAPEGQAVKAIVNGQLIIIRDGVKYNVQGQVIR